MKQALAALAILATTLLTTTARGDEYLYVDGQWVRQAAPAMGTPAGELALMRRHLDQGRYDKAVKLAEGFAKRYEAAEEFEEVCYLAGEAEYQRGRYWQAYQWYEKQLDHFPNGQGYERTLAREMAVGEQFLAGKKRLVWGVVRLGAQEEGLEILERVAERLPSSALAEQCLMKIGDYYFDKRQWDDAAAAYQRYGEIFGSRYRGGEAEIKTAQALHHSFKGPRHDETPLVEAEQRYKSYQAAYPRQAAEVDLPAVLEGIEHDKAAKDFETARFYDRLGRTTAAAFYYRQVIRQYGQTDWADQSRAALDKLALPAAPEAP